MKMIQRQDWPKLHIKGTLRYFMTVKVQKVVSEDDPKRGCAFYVCLERKASLTLASDTRIINKDLNQTEPQRLSNPVPFFSPAY